MKKIYGAEIAALLYMSFVLYHLILDPRPLEMAKSIVFFTVGFLIGGRIIQWWNDKQDEDE